MSDRSVYKSSTGVEVPLSFTGKHLLQNLRDAVSQSLSDSWLAGKRGEPNASTYWNDIGKARLELAKYMSKLEEAKRAPLHLNDLWRAETSHIQAEAARRGLFSPKPHYLEALALARDDQLRTAIERRGYKVIKEEFPPGHYTGKVTGVEVVDGHLKIWYELDRPSAPVVPSFPGPLRIQLEAVSTDELIKELKRRVEFLYDAKIDTLRHPNCRSTVVPVHPLLKPARKRAKKRSRK